MTVEVADDVAGLLAELGPDASSLTRELFVLELYRREVISSGKAAELLGMDRWRFVQFSGQRGVPYVRYPAAELEEEVRMLRDAPPPRP
jgi:predicted HTH domain antitoxin